MVDVAIVGCRRAPGGDPTDIEPDPDVTPLGAALLRRGATWTHVAWDDPGFDWSGAARVYLSGTWDSVERPAEYLEWTRRVSTVAAVVNPVTVVEWNLDKRYQRDLAGVGVPVIPTVWVEPGDTWVPPGSAAAVASGSVGALGSAGGSGLASHGVGDGAGGLPGVADVVIKPTVGGGGRATARYRTAEPDHARTAAAHVATLHAAGETAMVQPYLASVEGEPGVGGEIDLVYFDGTFSHAVRKIGPLIAGEGIVQRPWERMAWSGTAEPSAADLAVADSTVAVMVALLGCRLPYVRVDLLADGDGNPVILEVEAIDPYLSLDVVPAAAADRLAALLA